MTAITGASSDMPEVQPAQLRAYLASTGWDLVKSDPGTELWQASGFDSGREQVVLPTDSTFVDFQRRWKDAIDRVREVYDWDLVHLAETVRAIRSDLLFVRADQMTRLDSIPLKQADQLIQGTVQLLQAAAWSTVSPRSSLSGRKPNAVKDFVEDDVRMGHTRRGSFILTILTNMDDPEASVEDAEPARDAGGGQEAQEVRTVGQDADDDVASDREERSPVGVAADSDDASSAGGIATLRGRQVRVAPNRQIVLPPFPRRVMSTLATGLDLGQRMTLNSAAPIDVDDAVNRGVSSQMFAALHNMTRFEGLRTLDLSFEWAPLPRFQAPTIADVGIGRDSISQLEPLADRLKTRRQVEPTRASVVGRVLRLEREQVEGDEAEREVATVVGVQGRQTRRQVRVVIEGQSRRILLDAFDNQRTVTVTGELSKEGRGYWLRGEVRATI